MASGQVRWRAFETHGNSDKYLSCRMLKVETVRAALYCEALVNEDLDRRQKEEVRSFRYHCIYAKAQINCEF